LDNIYIILVLLIVVALLSFLSVNRRYLSISGAISAYAIGLILIFSSGVFYFVMLLIAFLITNLATSYRIEEKIKLKLIIAKKPIRDWRNVLGNGLPILFFAILEYFFSSDLFIFAFLASTATFLSDTVSTEIGVLSKAKPVMITNFKETHTGRSGAISSQGLLSGLAFSLLFAYISHFFFTSINLVALLFIVVVSSTLANLFDSLLGATVQINYYCDKCNMYSEEKMHVCGNECKKVSGYSFINNHVVNFISIFLGGLLSIAMALVLP